MYYLLKSCILFFFALAQFPRLTSTTLFCLFLIYLTNFWKKILGFSDLIPAWDQPQSGSTPDNDRWLVNGMISSTCQAFLLPLIMLPLVLWSLTLVSKEFCCSLFSFTPELLFLKLLWAVPRKLCIKSYHILPQLFHGLPFLSSRIGKAAEFVKYSTPTAVWVRVHDSDNSDLLNKQRLP